MVIFREKANATDHGYAPLAGMPGSQASFDAGEKLGAES